MYDLYWENDPELSGQISPGSVKLKSEDIFVHLRGEFIGKVFYCLELFSIVEVNPGTANSEFDRSFSSFRELYDGYPQLTFSIIKKQKLISIKYKMFHIIGDVPEEVPIHMTVDGRYVGIVNHKHAEFIFDPGTTFENRLDYCKFLYRQGGVRFYREV